MNIDAERVRERLTHIGDAAAKLRRLAALPPDEFFDDFRNLEAAQRLLQTSIQAMLDVATHVVARAGRSRAASNDALMVALADVGALGRQRLPAYREMARLRNLLVHEYLRVAPSEIRAILEQDLGDFDAFVGEVVDWLPRDDAR